jgi:signal transduction histidine kinase
MRAPSLRLIRWAGLVVWSMVGVAIVARESPRLAQLAASAPTGRPEAALAAMWAVLGTMWLAFGAAFVWLTRRVESRPSRGSLVALAVGLFIAGTLHTDLFLLLAACVPLVLSGRWLRVWIAAQLLLTIVVGLAIADTPEFEPIFVAPHLSPAVLVALTLGAVVAWQGLGFAVGAMAASEARGRLEMERTLGDLAATRELLSGSAQMAERLRIARDLHDVLGHHLAALSVNLDLAARRASGATAEAIR